MMFSGGAKVPDILSGNLECTDEEARSGPYKLLTAPALGGSLLYGRGHAACPCHRHSLASAHLFSGVFQQSRFMEMNSFILRCGGFGFFAKWKSLECDASSLGVARCCRRRRMRPIRRRICGEFLDSTLFIHTIFIYGFCPWVSFRRMVLCRKQFAWP